MNINSLGEKFSKFADELNSEQLEAATSNLCNHTLVIAGAGCGKTKSLIGRAAYLISQGVQPEKIQLLTFTRRAAKEMVDRLAEGMGQNPVCAGTFHSWCMALIRKSPGLFGLKQCTVIDEDDQLQIMKICRGGIAKPKNKLLQATQLIALMSYARNTMQSFSEALAVKHPELMDDKNQIEDIKQILIAYEKRKRSSQYLDYDDILQLVSETARMDPEVLLWIASGIDHILIDELQDTNPLQWSIIDLLSSKCMIFAVGDPRQSIYKFRGASFLNIQNFPQNLPKVITHNLYVNYRSTQEILNISNWLMENSSISYGKGLRSNRGNGVKPIIITCSDEMDEAQVIADEIVENAANGSSYSENMILGRSANTLRPIETALSARNIPYTLHGGHSIFKAAHIKDILSFVRIVGNLRDEIAWMRFLCLFKGVGEIKSEFLINKFRAVSTLGECSNIMSESPSDFITARNLINDIIKSNSISPMEVYQKAENYLLPELERLYENQNWENRKKDIRLVAQLAERHETILGFIEDYILSESKTTSMKDGKHSEDSVILSTIHAMKGAESGFVYLANISPDSCPPAWACKDMSDVEEERRVFYVGLTRAKNSLTLTRREFNSFSNQKFVKNKDGGVDVIEYFLNTTPQDMLEEKFSKSQRALSTSHKASNEIRAGVKFGMNFD